MDTVRSMKTLRTMTQDQTLEVARHESDEKMAPLLEVRSTLRYPRAVNLLLTHQLLTDLL